MEVFASQIGRPVAVFMFPTDKTVVPRHDVLLVHQIDQYGGHITFLRRESHPHPAIERGEAVGIVQQGGGSLSGNGPPLRTAVQMVELVGNGAFGPFGLLLPYLFPDPPARIPFACGIVVWIIILQSAESIVFPVRMRQMQVSDVFFSRIPVKELQEII